MRALFLALLAITACTPQVAENQVALRIIPAPPPGLEAFCKSQAQGFVRTYAECMQGRGYQAEIIGHNGQHLTMADLPQPPPNARPPVAQGLPYAGSGTGGQRPLPTTREPLATAMGGRTFRCEGGSIVTVNLARPPSISIRESSCSVTFIDGRNSTVVGQGCDLGLLLMPSVLVGNLMTMQQSVKVNGDNVTFYARQTPSVGMVINKGTGTFSGSFNMTSHRIHVDALTRSSATDEICRLVS